MKRKINSHRCKQTTLFAQIHRIQEEKKGKRKASNIIDGCVKKSFWTYHI